MDDLSGHGQFVHMLAEPQGKIGQMLLDRTAAVGADMMIMGAYGDSHERETVFGGNTQVVVDNATIPVVMVY